MKPKKKNQPSVQPKASSVRLADDTRLDYIPNRGLTPLREFDYSPDKDTYDALRFLSSWYNSDQYAGMEHKRGRDSSIPGRHMLQTPYGASRMGNRDTPYQRALDITYSPRMQYDQDLEAGTLGAWDEYDGTVSVANNETFKAAGFDDRAETLVHELYHASEGGKRRNTESREFGDPAVDQRYWWPYDQSRLGGGGRYSDLEEMDDEEIKRSILIRKGLQKANPYSEYDHKNFMRGLVEDFTNGVGENNPLSEGVWMTGYVNEPSEVTARLREAAFTAQNQGLLNRDDFRLTDEMLELIRSKSLAADQLLQYSTPEQRQFYYDNL
jgi:hypothetical protein